MNKDFCTIILSFIGLLYFLKILEDLINSKPPLEAEPLEPVGSWYHFDIHKNLDTVNIDTPKAVDEVFWAGASLFNDISDVTFIISGLGNFSFEVKDANGVQVIDPTSLSLPGTIHGATFITSNVNLPTTDISLIFSINAVNENEPALISTAYFDFRRV